MVVEAKVLATQPRRPGLFWPLVCTWLLYWLLWPAGLAPWGWALLRASRRRRRAAWAAALLASPFVVLPACSAGVAVGGYFTGTAFLTRQDLDRKRVTPVFDPALRCNVHYEMFPVSPGPELFSTEVHELVLRGLIRLLGPMPGAYTGPIPTSVEAHALLQRRVSTSRGPEGPVLFLDPCNPPKGRGRLLLVVEGRLLPIDVDHPDQLWPLVSPGGDRECRVGRAVPLDGYEQALLVAGAGTDPWERENGETALLVDLAHRRVVCRVWASPTPVLAVGE